MAPLLCPPCSPDDAHCHVDPTCLDVCRLTALTAIRMQHVSRSAIGAAAFRSHAQGQARQRGWTVLADAAGIVQSQSRHASTSSKHLRKRRQRVDKASGGGPSKSGPDVLTDACVRRISCAGSLWLPGAMQWPSTGRAEVSLTTLVPCTCMMMHAHALALAVGKDTTVLHCLGRTGARSGLRETQQPAIMPSMHPPLHCPFKRVPH